MDSSAREGRENGRDKHEAPEGRPNSLDILNPPRILDTSIFVPLLGDLLMPAHLHVRLHLIWSTHNREPRILLSFQNKLYRYLHGICDNINCRLLIAGGVDDHLHTYIGIPSTITDLVNALKSNSSRWIHEKFDPDFAWQTKYAAFSVSKSAEDALFAYIRGVRFHSSHLGPHGTELTLSQASGSPSECRTGGPPYG